MRNSLLKVVLLVFCALLWVRQAQAFQFVVSDIQVDGLQRVSAGTVFSAFPINIGDQVNEVSLSNAIRTLFHTGLFKDISVDRDKDVLIIHVKERPAIAKINIKGNKAIDTDKLKEGLKNAGLQEGQIFKRSTLEKLQLEILRSYVGQGRYNARVKGEVKDLPRNRVDITLKISEGKTAAIHHINIIGNKAFSDSRLRDLFELKTSDWWTSLFNDDKYSREKLSGDLEKLRSFYLDHGYIKFSIDSTQVSLSPDKKQVFITIAITEGPQYKIRDFAIKGKTILPRKDLRKLVLVKPGEVFSRQKLTATTDLISKRLGIEGYTFANVNAVPKTHDDDTATVTFYVDPGRRVYVHRINFSGNTVSKDSVLRQEMLQMEGAVASTDLIDKSKTRLERLGFFKSVNVETPSVPGRSDQIDVNYSVEEQPTGSLSASLGYSQLDGAIVGASVSEKNWMGTGKQVSLGANVSKSIKSANFSYLNPYYTVDGVSRGFSLFARKTDYAQQNITSYTLDNFGGNLSFGYPLDNVTRLNFGAGYSHPTVRTGNLPAQEVSQFLDQHGNNYNIYSVNASWVRNTLNRGVFPTNGYSHSVSAEVAVPGSNLEYYKLTDKFKYFIPLNQNQTWVAKFRTDLGFGDGYGKNSSMPFFEHFFSGGYGSVRGYRANSLGPTATPALGDASTPPPFGGNMLVEGSAELAFPVPFVKDATSMRSSFFFDAGNVFDTDRGYNPSLSAIRMSVGVNFQWITAIGPLGFSLAKPLNNKPGDHTQVFQFTLGQQF